MKRTRTGRLLAFLTALTLVLSLLSGLSLTAFADTLLGTPTGYTSASQVVYDAGGTYLKNWGARGEDCVFLTTYAQNYYTGSYTYANLSANSGSSSSSGYTSSALYTALHAMLTAKQTTTTTYSGTTGMYRYTDCVNNNSSYISSFYSATQVNGEWDSGATWNREHTWPQSKSTGEQKNDIMMLRPTAVSENSSRGNKAYGESSACFDPNTYAGSLGLNLRGDCARIMLYCYVRWSENASSMWGEDGVMESLDMLLDWIAADPVDTWEMGRNDAVQSITGVRNCFVDYPELAFLLFGRSVPAGMTTPSNGSGGSAPATVTLTYMANGAVYDTETTTAGQTVTLPASATAVSGWTFSGWVTEPLAATSVRPSFYAPGAGFTPSADAILYALYTQSDGGSGAGVWTRLDNAAELSAGMEIVLGEATYGVTAGALSSSVLGTTQSTFSADGQTISVLSGDALVLTVGGSSGAWTFANESGQLLGATAVKKLAWGSGATTWTVSISGGNATVQSTTSSYGRFLYNVSSPRFTTYTSNTSSIMLLPQIYYLDGAAGVVTYTTSPAGSVGSDYTVTFTTPDGITAPAAMTVNSLTGATLPTADAPEGWTFLGWVTEDYDHVTEQPDPILTGLYKPTADVTLKALYTCEDDSPRLTLMTVNDTFSDGDKIVITAAGTNHGLYRETYLRTYASDFEFTNDAEAILADPKTYFPVTQVDGGWWLGDDDNGYLYTPDNQVNLTIRTYSESFMTAFTLTTYDGHLALLHTVDYNDNLFYLKCGTDFSGGTKYKWRMVNLANGAVDEGIVTLDIYKLIENGPAVTYYTTLFAEEHVHTPADAVVENNVEPTCSVAGGYDLVVYCSECGEEISREHVTVSALGHDYQAVVTAPTCTEGGYTTYTCSRCGDAYVADETAALGHLPGEAVEENRVEPTATEAGHYDSVVYCQRCGAELSRKTVEIPATGPVEPIETDALHIYNSISVGTDMVITFTARKTDLTGYADFWIEVVKHNPDGDETYTYPMDQLTEGNSTWAVQFKNIYAKEMGVDIEARLYAEDAAGQIYMSPAKNANIRDYLGGRLTATNNTVAQRVLAADMLNYGAAAQMFTDFQTNHLVNEELTADQLAKLREYETTELPAVNKTNSNYLPEGESNILFTSVTLGNEVLLNLTVRLAEGTEGVQVLVKDHATGETVKTLDTTWGGSTFSATFNGIGADAMRTEYDLVTVVNGVETGNTRTWSVEAYVGEVRAENRPLKTAMANALLTYGDSAAAYFAAQ